MEKLRFKSILLVLVFTLAVPLYAFAEESETSLTELESIVVPYGAGEWDPVGRETISLHYSAPTGSKELQTGGGDFKVEITSIVYPTHSLTVQPVINGRPLNKVTVPITNNKGTVIIRDIPAGEIYFLYYTGKNDGFTFEYFD